MDRRRRCRRPVAPRGGAGRRAAADPPGERCAIGARRAGDRRRQRPLGRRGVARGRRAIDRVVPRSRRVSSRSLRGRRRHRRRHGHVRRGRRGDPAGTRHRLGDGDERRTPSGDRPRRPRRRRLDRGRRRRVRPRRAGARGSRRRHRRAVRDRHPRPARVRAGAGPGALRRDRGLLHGDAPRCAHRRRRVRRAVPLVPHSGHRVVVPGQGPWAAHRHGAAPGRQARASHVVRDRSGRTREVVEAELLPVPGSVARAVGPRAGPIARPDAD